MRRHGTYHHHTWLIIISDQMLFSAKIAHFPRTGFHPLFASPCFLISCRVASPFPSSVHQVPVTLSPVISIIPCSYTCPVNRCLWKLQLTVKNFNFSFRDLQSWTQSIVASGCVRFASMERPAPLGETHVTKPRKKSRSDVIEFDNNLH